MADRFIPLMACYHCGVVRQADTQICPCCSRRDGHPVTLVDYQELAVQVDVLIEPNPPGEGLK